MPPVISNVLAYIPHTLPPVELASIDPAYSPLSRKVVAAMPSTFCPWTVIEEEEDMSLRDGDGIAPDAVSYEMTRGRYVASHSAAADRDVAIRAIDPIGIEVVDVALMLPESPLENVTPPGSLLIYS